MMFDIDDPDYEKDVVNWIKDNIPECEEEVTDIKEIITTNIDFINTVIILTPKFVIIGFPNDSFRIYYPKEIKELHNNRLDRYVVDDLFWFYRERTKDIFGNNITLCSFGMDMNMPFLCL